MSMIWLSGLKRRKRTPVESPLKNVRVASPCRADWEKMAGDDRVRHCSECKLNVYNLSAMSRREAEELIAGREKRLCVRFYRRADGTILARDCPVGFRAAMARVSRIAGAVLSALMSVGFGVAQTEPIQGDVTIQHGPEETGLFVVVTDPQGAVIPGAQVSMVTAATKKAITGRTTNDGSLWLSLSSAGSYELKIESPGFKTLRNKITIIERKPQQLVVRLKLDERGIVEPCAAPMVDKTSSQVTNTFSGSLLQVRR